MAAVGYVKLSDLARKYAVNPLVAAAILRTLHSIDPAAWPYERVGAVYMLPQDTAVALMAHIDTHHRPTFRTSSREPQAARLARALRDSRSNSRSKRRD